MLFESQHTPDTKLILSAPTIKDVESARDHVLQNLNDKPDNLAYAAAHQFLLKRFDKDYIQVDNNCIALRVGKDVHQIFPVPSLNINVLSFVTGMFERLNGQSLIERYEPAIRAIKSTALKMERGDTSSKSIIQFVTQELATQCEGLEVIIEDNCVYINDVSGKILVYAGLHYNLSNYSD